MAKQKTTDQMLQELSELDQRLAKLQRFFQKSKTDMAEDSFFTEKNIEEAIRLLKSINPSEKSMIQTLQLMLPMTKQGKVFEKSMPQKLPMIRSSHSHSTCTAKIKGRTLPTRMI